MSETRTGLREVGSEAPALRFPVNGVEQSLRERAGPVWVLFYPLAFAPTCRDDLRQLAAAAGDLGHPEAPLLVVSVDRVEQARAFLESLEGNALTPVEDPQLEWAQAFGVARRERVAERATFLVQDGRVRYAQLHDLCLPRPLADLRRAFTA